MSNVTVEFNSKDQNWQDGETIYWFTLDGEDFHTGVEFDEDQFGVVEGEAGIVSYVDCDGCPIDGNRDAHAVVRALENAVTDELRAA